MVTRFPGGQDIARKWFVVDASGQTLGRLASRVASILAGKESPLYTPFIDVGDHVIASTVLHVVLRGQGSASGAGVSDTYVFVYKLRDGLVVEGWEYRTKQEALEAVGPSEQDVHADS